MPYIPFNVFPYIRIPSRNRHACSPILIGNIVIVENNISTDPGKNVKNGDQGFSKIPAVLL